MPAQAGGIERCSQEAESCWEVGSVHTGWGGVEAAWLVMLDQKSSRWQNMHKQGVN